MAPGVLFFALIKPAALPDAALYRVHGPVNLVRLIQLVDLVDDGALLFPSWSPAAPTGIRRGQAILPQLRQRPDAVLVNISSIFAMVSVPTQSIYNASKAAVRGFSDGLREELRGCGVDVLCVHPGGIKTNIANNRDY